MSVLSVAHPQQKAKERASERLINNFTARGLLHMAEKVTQCNLTGDHRKPRHQWRCHERHCPRCERAEAYQRFKKLQENTDLVRQAHPRAGFFAFTGRLVDRGVDCVCQSARALGQGMRKTAKAIGAYLGSYWQVDIIPSETIPGAIHPHVHAGLLIPAKDKPNAEEMNALWKQEWGLEAHGVHWGPVKSSPAWSRYVTKAEDLSEFDQQEFDLLIGQLYSKKMRGWIH